MRKYFFITVIIIGIIVGSLYWHRPAATVATLTSSTSSGLAAVAQADVGAAGGAKRPPLPSPAKLPVLLKESPSQSAASKQQDSPSATPTTQAPNFTLVAGNSTYATYAPAGSSVVDAMQTLQSAGNFTFTGRDFPSLGLFVDSINGKKNEDGMYWFLYVNGKSSDTGASQTILKQGDSIEWRYEKNH